MFKLYFLSAILGLALCVSNANAVPPAPGLMASVQNKSGNSLTICDGNKACKMIAPGERLTNTQPRNGDDAEALQNWLATAHIKTCERTIPLRQAVQPAPQERDQDGWYRLVIKEKYYAYGCESQLTKSSKDATLKRIAQRGVIKLG